MTGVPLPKTVYPSSEERSPGICFNTSLASFKDASRVCRTLVSSFPPFSLKTGRAAVMTVAVSSTASVCNIQLWVLPVGQGWQRVCNRWKKFVVDSFREREEEVQNYHRFGCTFLV